uniref:Uncharacterized protein n=1 Tax=Rhizophora mucronata TaxID=61149 RepID=A0A2P2N127_RHIMU
MSVIPTSGHPFLTRSCSCWLLNNRGNLFSQYMQLTMADANGATFSWNTGL